jgi:hypothetical protein
MADFQFTVQRGREPAAVTRAILPDIAAARAEALRLGGEGLGEAGGGPHGSDELTVTAADPGGLVLFTLTLLWTGAPALGEHRKPPRG